MHLLKKTPLHRRMGCGTRSDQEQVLGTGRNCKTKTKHSMNTGSFREIDNDQW